MATAISALALWSASSLRVEGGFEHLLPDGRPSVAEYRRVTERTAGVSTLFIVLEIGEVCTLLSTMLVLPAVLTWIDARQARRALRLRPLVQPAHQVSS